MGVTWYHRIFSIILDLISDKDLFMDHLQVPCLRHGLPLCVPASYILSHALSMESKSEFLQKPPMNIFSH